jgi:hypothetical protein
MPPPPRTGGPPVTNIRNTSSPHWRMWLKPENRCLVPANSFAEYAPEPNPETKKKDVVWFAPQRRPAALRLCRHLDDVQLAGNGNRSVRLPLLWAITISPARQSMCSSCSLATSPARKPRRTSMEAMVSNRDVGFVHPGEPTGQELLYAARVSLDRTQMQIDDKLVSLTVGMAVTAEIKTG